MTFCEHIMRADEKAEPRTYKRVWLAKCVRCEVRHFFCPEMFECVECRVFIHRRCWQSAACPESTSIAVAAPEGPRRPTPPPVSRPELSATTTDRGAELRTAPIELSERSANLADPEAEPRCAKSTRDVGTNTCQLDFGEPVVAAKPTGGCQAEPTFSPSDILRKMREAKRSRSSNTPGNISAHSSNEYVDLLGKPADRQPSTAPQKPENQVRRETLLVLRDRAGGDDGKGDDVFHN